MKKILKNIILFFCPQFIYLREFNNYLKEIGWVRSRLDDKTIDQNGDPLPWFTYPFIFFLSSRLNKDLEVFEYGSGNSTLYFADKTKSVVSIEHNKNYFDRLKKNIRENITLIYKDYVYNPYKASDYAKTIQSMNNKFDLIIIDGRDRVNCIKQSAIMLKDLGIIILDDSEREKYNDGISFLINMGFKKIDFVGFAPGCSGTIPYNKTTTIFYRANNCFNI